ncbi:MAG TPA: VTT domain-containing protein [Afipia sp.]
MQSYRSLIFYLVAVLVLALAYFASPISRETAWDLFPGLEIIARANPLATALMFLITSTVFAFLAFPAMPMIYTAAGFYMDGFEGGAIVLLGSALGGVSAFLFYRKHIQQHPAGALNEQSATKIWLTLLGLRLSPIVPAPLVNFFAAIFRVSPLQYLTTSVLGSAPLVLFYAQIGMQGRQFLSGEALHWRQFSAYLVILVLSTLLSAMGPWKSVLNELKQLKGSSGSESTSAAAGI